MLSDVPTGAIAYAFIGLYKINDARRRVRQARNGAFRELEAAELDTIRQTYKRAWPWWLRILVLLYFPVLAGLLLDVSLWSLLWLLPGVVLLTSFFVHDAVRAEIIEGLGDLGRGMEIAPRPSSAKRRRWTFRLAAVGVLLVTVASIAPVVADGAGVDAVVTATSLCALVAFGAAGWAWVWVYGDESEPSGA